MSKVFGFDNCRRGDVHLADAACRNDRRYGHCCVEGDWLPDRNLWANPPEFDSLRAVEDVMHVPGFDRQHHQPCQFRWMCATHDRTPPPSGCQTRLH